MGSVEDWGWTYISWPDFVKRFPEEAAAFVCGYTDGWDEDEIEEMGGEDVLKWEDLYDEECWVTPDGSPIIIANLTGVGGSLFLKFTKDNDESGWEEVLYDDDGNIEE